MSKLKTFIEITRPINTMFTFVVVLVSIIICSEEFVISLNVILASISAALVAASGNIINDYFDYEIDKFNRPNRPIPSGGISKKVALGYYLFLSTLAIFISAIISFSALLIVILTLVILFFYSKYFKSLPLIGNVTVSLCTALAFIYGGVIAKNIEVSFIPAIFAFLINLIREILKDIEDLEGDKKNNLRTFPIKYGIEKTSSLLFIISTILVLATFYPYFTELYKIEYFIIVLFLVNLPIIFLIKEIITKKFLSKISLHSSMLKIVMIFGLLSIYLGVK